MSHHDSVRSDFCRHRLVDRDAQPELPSRRFIRWLIVCWIVAQCLTIEAVAQTVERVKVKDESVEQEYRGEIQVEDDLGGVLVLTADGHLWPCSAKRIVEREKLNEPFKPLTADQLAKQLVTELGNEFQIHKTAHYVVAHNTNETYVKWCAGLFERLHRGFYVYWKSRGWKLEEPKFPLVAIVFNSREAFLQYARPEVGEGVESIIGYYNMHTNRMVTYALADPERRVATLIHEAAHQIAFNSAMQTRLADNPLWVSEGLAMYFEAPDLSNSRGWGTIGKINEVNFQRFRQYLPTRPNDSLQTLIQDDRRFSGEGTSLAYGEAWALNYFLLKTKSKQYVAYLQDLAKRPPLEATDPQRRLEEFVKAFGDLNKLDAEFLRYMDAEFLRYMREKVR